MENSNQQSNPPAFNESEWIRLIFLLSDTQHWMNEMIQQSFLKLPLKDSKKLFRKTYHLTVSGLAHILERHYYKIHRHPGTSKFTVPLTELLAYLRDASIEPATPIPGILSCKRTLQADKTIGIDYEQLPTNLITVLTDPGGTIITAFPGCYQNR